MSEDAVTGGAPTKIEEVQAGMRLQGTVRRIELYGAFVDIGLERDGLIHISRLSDRRVDRVSDVVKVGDTVAVWVTNVDPSQGRISLTLVEPPDVDWDDLQVGQTYTGKISRLERYGAFVEIGAERAGLLHAREMGGEGFQRPSEMFQIGDEVDVRIMELDRRKKRIDLTMDSALDYTDGEEGEEEDLPSSIEMAFRRAQSQPRRGERKRRPAARPKWSTRELDELLARTLEQHAEE